MTPRQLDQFYTRPGPAAACIAQVRAHCGTGTWLWVEPAAGAGAFFDRLPTTRIGLDIAATRGDLLRQDFLTWAPPGGAGRVAVVGNPPFGRNASLARAFLNHAASFADVIGFILPRTFEKATFVNGVDRRLHLVHQQVLDPASFEFDGAPYAVPTVFQIWERRVELRPLTAAARQHADWNFTVATAAHFAFQRVGARAGLVSREGLRKSPQSHYFLRARADHQQLFDRLAALDWAPIKQRTAGNPSIGKGELVAAYAARYG